MPAMPWPPMAAEVRFCCSARETPEASAAPGCWEPGLRTVSSMWRMRQAASAAAAMALALLRAGSQMRAAKASWMPSESQSTPNDLASGSAEACFLRRALRTSVASKPEFMASCRGTTSRARATARTASWSLPTIWSAISRRWRESSISMAPAPATTVFWTKPRLAIMRASWIDRWDSSMNCSEPPRRTTVAVFASGQPVKTL
mmetsp:Transcript_16459/g.51550  ORF Transcript_16459/g.51550 Transcript_16459/m.51550 type:complete len:203 (+) Transcript_16459:273-881(+)